MQVRQLQGLVVFRRCVIERIKAPEVLEMDAC
jgi:hypothetical protein